MRKWMQRNKCKLVSLVLMALMCTIVQVPNNPAEAQSVEEKGITLSKAVQAQESRATISGNWTDNLTEQPAGYVVNGNTITISSAEGLAWLSVVSNGMNGQTKDNFVDKKIKLGADIDLANKYWFPIGVYGGSKYGYAQFCGNFNGQGHTISNMSVLITEQYQYAGLFGNVYSQKPDIVIENFHLESPSVITDRVDPMYMGTGAVIGCLEQHDSMDWGSVTVQNISVHNATLISNPQNSESYVDKTHIGGIVGYGDQGVWSIKNCFFQGSIQNGNGRGGILSYDRYGKKTVENCYYIAENVPYGSKTEIQEMAEVGTSITLDDASTGEYTWKLDTSNGGSHSNLWQQDFESGKSMPCVGKDGEKRVYRVSIVGVYEPSLSSLLYVNTLYILPSIPGITYKDTKENEVSGQQTLSQDVSYKAYGTIQEASPAKVQLSTEQEDTVLTVTATMYNEDGTPYGGIIMGDISLYQGQDKNGTKLETKEFAVGRNQVSFKIDVSNWLIKNYDFYVSYSGSQGILPCDEKINVELRGKASVGDNHYFNLQDAFDAAADGESFEERTVTLLQDITVNAPIALERGDVTLDTNGYTLAGEECLEIRKDAVFTLDGKKNEKSKSAVEADLNAIKNFGKCSITNASVFSKKRILYNEGECTVTDASLEGEEVNNAGKLSIANSELKECKVLNRKTLIIEKANLKKNNGLAISNYDSAHIEGSVGVGCIENYGNEFSFVNNTWTSGEQGCIFTNGKTQKVTIEDSCLINKLSEGSVIYQERMDDEKETAVIEIRNSSLIAPEDGYVIVSPTDDPSEPTDDPSETTEDPVEPSHAHTSSEPSYIPSEPSYAPSEPSYTPSEPIDDRPVETELGGSNSSSVVSSEEVDVRNVNSGAFEVTNNEEEKENIIVKDSLIFGECKSKYAQGLGYTAWGNVALPQSLTIPEGKILTVKDNAVLEIPKGMELTNKGTLWLDGKLTGEGALTGSSSAAFVVTWFDSEDINGIRADGYTYKGSPYTLEDGLEDVTIASEKMIMGQAFAINDFGYRVGYENTQDAGEKDSAKITFSKHFEGGHVYVEKAFTINRATLSTDLFTYKKPANLLCDGEAKVATVTPKEGVSGIGEITVHYYKDGKETEPVQAGDYNVEISLEEGNNYLATEENLKSEEWTFTINHMDENSDGFCDGCSAYLAPEYKDNYYQIANAGNLMWFAEQVNEGKTTLNAKLTKDIDLTGVKWTIMDSYAGVFDGAGYTISGLCKDSELGDGNRCGLIQTLSSGGKVTNLTITGATLYSTNNAGAIAAENNGSISKCMVKDSTIMLGVSHGLAAIAGINNGTITDCGVVGCSLQRCGDAANNADYTIGCVAETNNGTVKNCYSFNCTFENTPSGCAVVASGVAPENSYYYTTSDVADAETTVKATEQQFVSGEVTYWLNKSASDGAISWGQNLKENAEDDDYDAYPVFKNNANIVYFGYENCFSTEKIYANIELFDEIPNHEWKYELDGTNTGKMVFSCTKDACTKGGTVVIAVPTAATYNGSDHTATVTIETEDDKKLIETPDITYASLTDGVELVDGKPVNAGTYRASVTLGEVTAYLDFEIEKAEIVIEAVPTVNTLAYHPNNTLADVALSGGTVNGVNGTITGSWAWKDETIHPQLGEQNYVAVFTPTDEVNYKSEEASITVNVEKATVYIATAPTANAITYGESLSDSTLSDAVVWHSEEDAIAVAGTWSWKEETTTPTVADSDTTQYEVVFKPTDSDNYKEIETKITLTVNKSETTPNMPENTMSALYTQKTVGAVALQLPEGWVWNETDRAKELTVGKAVEATAIYNGADKGNYVTESVVIAITRNDCKHTGETEVKDAKEATCGEEGYTGDTYCVDCGEKTATGKVIGIKAHTYEEPIFNWSEDGQSCTVTFTCKNDASHTDTQNAIVTSKVKTEATCKAKGTTTYTASYTDADKVYSAEGKTYTDTKDIEDIPVDLKNHVGETEVKDAKEATCKEDGYTGDTYCKHCQTKIAQGKVIPKTDKHSGGMATCKDKAVCDTCKKEYGNLSSVHTWDAGKVTKEATASAEGEKTFTCKTCGTTKVEKIPVIENNNVVNKVNKDTGKKLPGIGEKITNKDAIYQVTTSDSNGGTVTYVALTNKKAKSAVIPATITINNFTYKVTAIGKNAFSGCKKLKSVTIGKNVETIGTKAFYKCTSLAKVTIPSKVKNIGKNAFNGCKKLKAMTIKSTKLTTKTIGSKAFAKTPKKMTVKVPKKKFKTYKSMLIKRGVNKKAKFKKN